jgi:hypothetical protein
LRWGDAAAIGTAILWWQQAISKTFALFEAPAAALDAGLGAFTALYGTTLDSIKNGVMFYLLRPLRIRLDEAVLTLSQPKLVVNESCAPVTPTFGRRRPSTRRIARAVRRPRHRYLRQRTWARRSLLDSQKSLFDLPCGWFVACG